MDGRTGWTIERSDIVSSRSKMLGVACFEDGNRRAKTSRPLRGLQGTNKVRKAIRNCKEINEFISDLQRLPLVSLFTRIRVKTGAVNRK